MTLPNWKRRCKKGKTERLPYHLITKQNASFEEYYQVTHARVVALHAYPHGNSLKRAVSCHRGGRKHTLKPRLIHVPSSANPPQTRDAKAYIRKTDKSIKRERAILISKRTGWTWCKIHTSFDDQVE
eukprot:8098804-Pyramimonas_sp.AAC.1